MLANNQGNYLNKSETEVELEILFIASPIRPEIGKTSIFLTFLVSINKKLLLFKISLKEN